MTIRASNNIWRFHLGIEINIIRPKGHLPPQNLKLRPPILWNFLSWVKYGTARVISALDLYNLQL